jgi:hypothetical protein
MYKETKHLHSDGDGVDDVNDTCIYNKFISTTSFEDYIAVDLYPGHSTDPKWKVKAVGRRQSQGRNHLQHHHL